MQLRIRKVEPQLNDSLQWTGKVWQHRAISWRIPCRVDFVGGTLDIWPICLWHQPVAVVNMAIDVGPVVRVKPAPQWQWVDERTQSVWSGDDPQLPLLFREFQKHWGGTSGYQVSWLADAWSGAGLGHSSSLLVGLLKAVGYWLPGKGRTWRQWWQWLVNVETGVLGALAGWQDYVPAITGGACLITYENQQWSWLTEHPQQWGLPRFGVIAYSQQAHHSGLSNFDVLERWVKGDSQVRNGLAALARLSWQVAQALMSGQSVDWLWVLQEQRQQRLAWQPQFEPQSLLSLEPIARDMGGVFKVVGAGHGGSAYIGFWDPQTRDDFLKQAQHRFGHLSFRLVTGLPSARIQPDDVYPYRPFPEI